MTGLAQGYAAATVHVQVLTGTPGALTDLSALPQVGSVVDTGDPALVRRVVEHLSEEVLGAHSGAAGPELTVIVVDGWEAVEDAMSDAVGPGADALLRLIRDGAPRGLRAIVTGGRTVGSGRLASLLDRRLVLAMPDPLDLTLVGLDPATARLRRGPGRAIDLTDGAELQVAAIGPGPSHDEQSTAVRGVAAALKTGSCSRGQRPWRLLPLPSRLDLRPLIEGSPRTRSTPATPGGRPPILLGVGGDAATPISVDVTRQASRFLVVGPPGSGRSNVLEVLVRQLVVDRQVAIVASRRSPLLSWPSEPGLHLLTHQDVGRFVDLRRAHPDLAVIVDDADSLQSGELEQALVECTGRVDDGGGLVWAAAETTGANAAFRGLIPALARHGNGLVLWPRATADGDCLRARTDAVGRLVPGRGSLVLDSRCLPIQVARADTAEEPDGAVPSGRSTEAGTTARVTTADARPVRGL